MGVDPGIARVGWSIIKRLGPELKPIAYGCIETDKGKNAETRLNEIYDAITHVLVTHHPVSMAVEDLFFSTNVKTAIGVGQSRGVVQLALHQNKIPIFEYTPLQVKMSLTGYGRAEKQQIQAMVKQILKLPEILSPDDVADAAAIALTHCFSYKINSQIK